MFFDAPESSFRNISLWVYNRNPSRLDGMLELLVASGLRNLEPAVELEILMISRLFIGALPSISRIHISYTLIKERNLPHWRN